MGGGNLRHLGMVATSGSWRRHWLFLWHKNSVREPETKDQKRETVAEKSAEKAKQ